jgi:hypothetical protein
MAIEPNLLVDVNGNVTEIRLLTVLGSAAGLATNHTATIVLETKEYGTLGLPVTLHSCAMLRKAIADAEQFLHHPQGHA